MLSLLLPQPLKFMTLQPAILPILIELKVKRSEAQLILLPMTKDASASSGKPPSIKGVRTKSGKKVRSHFGNWDSSPGGAELVRANVPTTRTIFEAAEAIFTFLNDEGDADGQCRRLKRSGIWSVFIWMPVTFNGFF